MPCLFIGVLSGLLAVLSALALGAGPHFAMASYLVAGCAVALAAGGIHLGRALSPRTGRARWRSGR